MKPILRIALASLSGLVIGWGVNHFRTVGPPPAPVSVKVPAPCPAKLPPPEWLTWLKGCAPLQPVLSAGEFWQRLPLAGKCPKIEWDLPLDEAFFTIPPDAFFMVLSDERFSRLPRLYEVDESAIWSRKLMGIGLEEALSMAGRMPTSWLNEHLEHRLLDTMARQDPERGYEWLKQSSAGDQWLAAEYLEQVAKHNVDKAAGMFGKLDASMRWLVLRISLKLWDQKTGAKRKPGGRKI